MKFNGRIKVKTLCNQFHDEFGLTMRVYDKNRLASEDATLASIRKVDTSSGEITPRKSMKIGNLEQKIMREFGIKIQIAGSDNSYLCNNDLTLSKALKEDELKMIKKIKNNESLSIIEKETIRRVRVIIRNEEDPDTIEQCMFFDLFTEQLGMQYDKPLTINRLESISNTLFQDETKINEIKRILADYNLSFNLIPKLWISKINDLDLTPLLQFFFDNNQEKRTEANSILIFEDNIYKLEDMFESDMVHSVEGLGENIW